MLVIVLILALVVVLEGIYIKKIKDRKQKGIVLQNIDLTGVTIKDQEEKIGEEWWELDAALESGDRDSIMEETWDNIQVLLGYVERVSRVNAEMLMRYYPKHLEKLKDRPRLERDKEKYEKWRDK